MKKLFLVLVSSFLFVSVAQAAARPDVTEIKGRSIPIDGVTIIKYDDGRVAPVAHSSKLSLNQVNQVLREMKVPNEKIGILSIETKKMIISNGGVAVELQNEQTKRYYNSLDGQRFLVTDENKEEVKAVQEQDKLSLLDQSNNGITAFSTPVGSDSEGIWSASSILFYNGKSGVEHIYDLYSEYNWSSSSLFYYYDTIAHSWDSQSIVSSTSNGANNWRNMISHNIVQDPMTIKRDFGLTQGNFNLKNSSTNYGALHDRLHIPDTYTGHTKMIKSSYAHPWVSKTLTAKLGLLGITWPSGWNGDDWYWDGTFKVGE